MLHAYGRKYIQKWQVAATQSVFRLPEEVGICIPAEEALLELDDHSGFGRGLCHNQGGKGVF